jgi:hypothetical protein
MRLYMARIQSPLKMRARFLTAMKSSYLMPMPRCRRCLLLVCNSHATIPYTAPKFVIELSPAGDDGADDDGAGSYVDSD